MALRRSALACSSADSRTKPTSPPGLGRIGILGIILREHGEILALLDARVQAVDLLARLRLILGLVVAQIADVGVGRGRHQDLRQVNLGLGQIEVGLVGVVELGDVLVGNADAGRWFPC